MQQWPYIQTPTMNNSNSIRIRKALISPTTPRSLRFYFSPENSKNIEEQKTVEEPQTQSDPFSELKITNHKKLRPVVLKHPKKFSSGHTTSLSNLNMPQTSRIELKSKTEKKVFSLPVIQKEGGLNLKSLSNCNSGVTFRPMVHRRESFKVPAKENKDLEKINKRVSFNEKVVEVSFGK